MIKILFTGVGRRIELVQEFRKASQVLGIPVKIYGGDGVDTAPALSFCDAYRKTVSMRDPSYIDELLKTCKADGIDVLIPTIDTDLLVLSQNRERFDEIGTKVLISAPEMIAICRDKNNTSAFFEKCGLKTPMPVNNWREYKHFFPAFIKPKDGSSSIDAYRVDNATELEDFAGRVEDYIVQPFVEGTEYTVDIFCDFDGNPIYITPRIRLQVRAGEVLKTEIVDDTKIVNECKALIREFKPCGPMTVQLIRDKAGDDWYIEINPRYGGGAPLSMKAGAKSAEALLALVAGKEVPNHKLAVGAVYSRFDQSVAIDAGSGLKGEIRGVIFDLDDTLYNEKEYVSCGFKAVAEYLNDESAEEILKKNFEAGKSAIDECLKQLGRETELKASIEAYRENKPVLSFNSGAKELITSLLNRGIKVGIITDGRVSGQINKLEALGLNELLGEDNIIITDALGGPDFRKPCDIAFRILARRWKLNYENIVYVGDNATKDFQATRQLGMQSLWFDNPEGLYRSVPDIAVTSSKDFKEIENHILNCL